MLIGSTDDDEADEALDALSEEEPVVEESVIVGLTDSDLDALLGEDF